MTGQLALFDVEDLAGDLTWLARDVVRANALLHIHLGQRAQAVSEISSSMAGSSCGGVRWEVRSGSVTWTHPLHGDGSTPVRTLVGIAADHHNPERGAALAKAYREYIAAWTRPLAHSFAAMRRTPEHLAAMTVTDRALDAAARAWWSP